MKKLLLLLLCVPLIGLGQIETPVQQTNWDNLGSIIVITPIVGGFFLFSILIIRAGRKLNSGSLTAAGVLLMILWCYTMFITYETLSFL